MEFLRRFAKTVFHRVEINEVGISGGAGFRKTFIPWSQISRMAETAKGLEVTGAGGSPSFHIEPEVDNYHVLVEIVRLAGC
jgi:hypothetical protein